MSKEDRDGCSMAEELKEDNLEWCSCQLCTLEPNLEKKKCCRSLPDHLPTDGSCITLSQPFIQEVLDKEVLKEKMDDFGVDTSRPDAYYHCACRLFTRWMYGVLGQGNRIAIPACVLRAFRENLPFQPVRN